MEAVRIVFGLVFCALLAGCSGGDPAPAGIPSSAANPHPHQGRPYSVAAGSPSPAAKSPTSRPATTGPASGPATTSAPAACASLVVAWKHQLQVTQDAVKFAGQVTGSAQQQQAKSTAQHDQEIADGMRANLVRLGCPVS
jgi:hypothetical protein